jgi:hypothetical protein
VAPGKPSTLHIVAGEIEYTKTTSTFPTVAERLKRMVGMRMPVEKGFVWRLDNQIAVQAEQGFLHKLHKSTSRGMGIGTSLYLSPDPELSSDPEHPNIFEASKSYDIRRGQPQFDIFPQQESVAEFDGTMLTYTEAVGCLNGDTFSGKFFGAGDIKLAVPVAPVIKFEVLGWFRLKLGN